MRWKVLKLFPILLALPFFSGQVLLTVGENVDGDGEDYTARKAYADEDEMKCVCDGDCEPVRESDCTWGLTLDVCGCCFLCARGENEPCAGALGTCALGLRCQLNGLPENRSMIKEGTCSRDKGKCDVMEKHYGCMVRGGKCRCEERFGCPGEEMFLFDTEDSCRTHTAFLITRRYLEPISESLSSTDDCHEVQCPKAKKCPSDSYRLPTIIESSQEICCPPIQDCHCNPGLLCPSPIQCLDGSSAHLVTNLTGQPGKCCPIYECKENNNEDVEKVKYSVCSFDGEIYYSGESWTHQMDCTECNCYHGVVSCKPIQCDLHSKCALVRAAPGSCCPVCVGCIGNSGSVHNNSDIWEEDPCTTCECTEGRIKCHAAMCQTTCSNPIHISGECCPRCDS